MRQSEINILTEVIVKWRSVAEKSGPMHTYWDLIFDAESMVRGDKARLDQCEVVREAKAILGLQ